MLALPGCPQSPECSILNTLHQCLFQKEEVERASSYAKIFSPIKRETGRRGEGEEAAVQRARISRQHRRGPYPGELSQESKNLRPRRSGGLGFLRPRGEAEGR